MFIDICGLISHLSKSAVFRGGTHVTLDGHVFSLDITSNVKSRPLTIK